MRILGQRAGFASNVHSDATPCLTLGISHRNCAILRVRASIPRRSRASAPVPHTRGHSRYKDILDSQYFTLNHQQNLGLHNHFLRFSLRLSCIYPIFILYQQYQQSFQSLPNIHLNSKMRVTSLLFALAAVCAASPISGNYTQAQELQRRQGADNPYHKVAVDTRYKTLEEQWQAFHHNSNNMAAKGECRAYLDPAVRAARDGKWVKIIHLFMKLD